MIAGCMRTKDLSLTEVCFTKSRQQTVTLGQESLTSKTHNIKDLKTMEKSIVVIVLPQGNLSCSDWLVAIE